MGVALFFRASDGSHDKSFASVFFFLFTKPTQNIFNVSGVGVAVLFSITSCALDRIGDGKVLLSFGKGGRYQSLFVHLFSFTVVMMKMA